MTPEQFTYWLKGFMELTNANTLDTTQFQKVKDHLDLVFKKETPNRTNLQELLKKPNTTQPYSPQPYDIKPYRYDIICEYKKKI